MTIALKTNVPGYVDELGRFRPIAAVPSSNRRGEMSFDDIDRLHGRELVNERKRRKALRSNPDLLSMFANAAVGVASTLQINEMVKRKSRRKNPLSGEGKGSVAAARLLFSKKLAEIRKYPEKHLIDSAYSLIGYITASPAGEAALRRRIKAAADAGLKRRPNASGGRARVANPTPDRDKRGDLYVLTIGSGDDLISVYLHDGDKDGFSKRFKTMAAARAYATRNKIKIVENPAPAAVKANGFIKRAWARSRAKAEYGRELRLASAAERARKRRSQYESDARSNPKGAGKTIAELERVNPTLRPPKTFEDIERLLRRLDRIRKRKDGTYSQEQWNTRKEIRRLIDEWWRRDDPQSNAKANPRRRTMTSTEFRSLVDKAHPYRIIVGGKDTGGFGTLAKAREWVKQHGGTVKMTIPKKAPARRNPKTTARRPTYEMFQGRKATTAKPMIVSNHAPARLDQLGDLIELKIAGGQTLKFNGGPKLCAAGGKLWIAGKRFAKACLTAKANEINPIGEIDHVVYGTHKPHHGDHAYTHYIHKLGEESGKRPILCVDRDGFPVIRGGNYTIEARGIVD